MCKVQLRTQTLNMGGNAVVAADIDYSEVVAEQDTYGMHDWNSNKSRKY